MRHYEIVVIIHPDQSEQVSQMVEKYKTQITDQGGAVHRFEDWGRRQLAYPINKIHKGHYIMLNIECSTSTLSELNNAFKFNDAVIRTLVINTKQAITGESLMLKNPEEKREHSDHSERAYEPREPRELDAEQEPEAASAEETL